MYVYANRILRILFRLQGSNGKLAVENLRVDFEMEYINVVGSAINCMPLMTTVNYRWFDFR